MPNLLTMFHRRCIARFIVSLHSTTHKIQWFLKEVWGLLPPVTYKQPQLVSVVCADVDMLTGNKMSPSFINFVLNQLLNVGRWDAKEAESTRWSKQWVRDIRTRRKWVMTWSTGDKILWVLSPRPGKRKEEAEICEEFLDDASKNAKIVSTKTLEKTAIISCSCWNNQLNNSFKTLMELLMLHFKFRHFVHHR